MTFPFGFEGFEDQEDKAELHPTRQELESYCKRFLCSAAEVGQDEFMKMESHLSMCDSCLLTSIDARLRLIRDEPEQEW
jgi:hypothetical protein